MLIDPAPLSLLFTDDERAPKGAWFTRWQEELLRFLPLGRQLPREEVEKDIERRREEARTTAVYYDLHNVGLATESVHNEDYWSPYGRDGGKLYDTRPGVGKEIGEILRIDWEVRHSNLHRTRG